MVDTISKVKGVQFDSNNLDAYTASLKGLSDTQAKVVLSSAGLDKAQQKQILSSLNATKSTITLTSAEAMKSLTEELGSKKAAKNLLLKSELVTKDQLATGAKFELNKQMVLEAINLEKITQEEGEQIITAFGLKSGNVGLATSFKLLGKSIGQAFAVLMTNPFTYLVAGLVSTIVVIKQTTEAIEGIRDKAQELGSSFNDSKSEIEGYKSQIQDLYKIINDSGSSIEEVAAARQTLMTVQDELIDKFGDEKETIDLVTQAINGQSAALDDLIDKQWQETKNEFNKGTFWGNFSNWSQGYENNLERMIDEMENPKTVRIGMSINDFNSGKYSEIIRYMEELGWSFSDTLSAFTKDGGLEDLYEDILQIQAIANKDNAPTHFLKELTSEANKAKDTLDDYEGLWDNYILNDRIFEDDSLANSWKEVNDAYSKYQKAVQSGDKTAIEASIAGFASSINTVLGNKNVDDSVKDYFKDMYPALYREVEKWEFKTTIIPDFDTSGLQGKTQADILKMLQTDGMQEGEDIFNSIVESAITYALILDDNAEGIQKVLDLLVEWGILQGTISENAPDANEMTVSLSELEGASDKIKTVGDAFKEFSDNGYLSVKTLGELKTATGFSDEEFEKYKNTLLNVKMGSAEFNKIMSEMTFKILDNTFKTKDLTDVTEDEIATVLRENNVTNAGAIAKQYKAKATLEAKLAEADYSKGIDAVVSSLGTEAEALGLTQQEVIDLASAYAEAQASMNEIVADSVHDRLGILSDESEGIKSLADAYALLSKDGTVRYTPDGYGKDSELVGSELSRLSDDEYAAYLADREKILAYGRLQDKINELKNYKIDIPNYSVGGGKSGSDDTPDYEDPTDAIINRINLRSKEIEKQEEEIQNLIEIAELENDYKKQISLTNDKLALQKQRIDALKQANSELHTEAQRLRDATPNWNEEEWFDSQGNATEAYYNLLNSASTKDEQERIKDLFESLSKYKEAYKDNAEEIHSINEELLQDEYDIVKLQGEYFDKQISTLESQIEFKLGIDETADVTDEYRQIQAVLHQQADYYRSLPFGDWTEEIAELQKLWQEYEDKIADSKIEEYLDKQDELIKKKEYEYNQEQAIIDGLRKKFDIQKQIRDEQAEIDAELDALKSSEDWQDSDTRRAALKDYEILSDELDDINKNIKKLYADYQFEISSLSQDEWYKEEEIAAAFEARIDAQMESYEIAQKELEVTKKRNELQNVMNQRNTRVVVAGGWRLVADPTKLQEAQRAASLAETEKKNLELTNAENETIRSMQAVNEARKTERLAIESLIETINNWTNQQRRENANNLDSFSVTKSSSRKAPDEWFNPEKQGVRYVGIDENGKLMIEPVGETKPLPDLDALYEPPRSSIGDILLRNFDSVANNAQLILQSIPNYAAMMPNFTTPVIPDIQPNTTSNVVQYTINTGDVVIENPIEADDFAYELTNKLSTVADLSKNMRK